MRAGMLNKRITIQQKATPVVQDEFGEEDPVWETVATVWASAEPLRGQEYLEAMRLEADIDIRFRIRYYAGLTPAMRVYYDGRYFNIISVIDVYEHHVEMQLMCKEQLGVFVAAAVATPWYLAGGVELAHNVVAFQPRKAATYAAGLINLTHPTLYPAVDVAAPGWDGESGWIFPSTRNKYLQFGPITYTDQMTAYIRFSGLVVPDYDNSLFGVTNRSLPAVNDWNFDLSLGSDPDYFPVVGDWYEYLLSGIAHPDFGVLALNKNGVYLNGRLVNPFSGVPTAFTTTGIWCIGANNDIFNDAIVKFTQFNCQAFGLFDQPHDDATVRAISLAMANI